MTWNRSTDPPEAKPDEARDFGRLEDRQLIAVRDALVSLFNRSELDSFLVQEGHGGLEKHAGIGPLPDQVFKLVGELARRGDLDRFMAAVYEAYPRAPALRALDERLGFAREPIAEQGSQVPVAEDDLPVPGGRRRRPRKGRWLVACGLAILSVILILAFALRREPSPTIVLRPPIVALSSLAEGGRLCVWQVESLSDQRVPLARMVGERRSLLIGRAAAIEQERINKWSEELEPRILNPSLIQRTLGDWEDPVHCLPRTRLRQGMILQAEVHAPGGEIHARTRPFTITEPFVDILMERVEHEVEARGDCLLPSGLEPCA